MWMTLSLQKLKLLKYNQSKTSLKESVDWRIKLIEKFKFSREFR